MEGACFLTNLPFGRNIAGFLALFLTKDGVLGMWSAPCKHFGGALLRGYIQ